MILLRLISWPYFRKHVLRTMLTVAGIVLGVLQPVGGLHGQIRRTIWIEALSIGTLGLLLGFALGAINLYYILQIVHRDIAGMRLDYQFPTTVVAALVPTILASAFVAAIWPAESAVRGSLVEALGYE